MTRLPAPVKNLLKKILPRRILQLRQAMRLLDTMHFHVDTRTATYNHDGLVVFNDSDFLMDSLFQEAYRLGKATGSWGKYDIEWRAYVACWAARHALHFEGDFVECGVNRGGLSRTVMHYIDFASQPGRRFFLLDTYCGFPDDMKHLASPLNLNDYSECYDDVVRTFSPFPNAVIIRGKVPDTLPQADAKKVCYLSLDMNVAEPEVAAAEYYWDRLSSGAVILLDDYGFGPAYQRQKIAMDEFAARHGVQVLLLPTGQGLIFKP